MGIMDNTIKVANEKNLYLKNTMGLKIDVLQKSDYQKLAKVKILHFIMDAKVKGKRHRQNLTPVKTIGRQIASCIVEVRNEKDLIIEALKSGEYHKQQQEDQALSELKTFDELWTSYTEDMVAMNKMRASYKRNNDYFYGKHLKPKIGNKRIDEISPDMMTGIVRKMKMDGYASATIDQIRKVFGVIFLKAVEKKQIEKSPLDDVVFPEYDNVRDFQLSDDQATKLYNEMMAYPELKFRGIFMFLLEGRRIGEVLGLTWDRIDLKGRRYWFESDQNKSKKKKKYILPEHLVEVLVQLADNRTGYVFKSSRPSKSNNGKAGGKIDNIRKRWKSFLKTHELPEDLHIHDLRHWIGNTTVNDGATYEHISYALGQSSESIAKRYSKVHEETAHRTVGRFHAIYSDKS